MDTMINVIFNGFAVLGVCIAFGILAFLALEVVDLIKGK